MYAVIEACGKQYRVAEGDVVFLDKMDIPAGETVTFDKVLVLGSTDEVKIGTPLVAGASVTASVVKSGKSKKIMVFKYNAKKNYRRRQGHRQPYTKVQIDKITG